MTIKPIKTKNTETTGKTSEYQTHPGGKFKKGNPGRPFGSKNYETIMNEALEELARLQGIKPEELEKRIYMKGASEALKGDYSFYRDYQDRKHGRPTKTLKVEEDIVLKIDV